jgi:hypothetical protein
MFDDLVKDADAAVAKAFREQMREEARPPVGIKASN